MSPISVPDCQLVCLHCPPGTDGRPPVVSFHHSQDQVRCPDCRRWYRVITRELATPTQQMPLEQEGRSRYRIVTAEPDGRQLLRTFIGTPGLRLAIGARVSLVYSSGRLAGIANQSTGTWFRLPEPSSRRGSRVLEYALLGLVGVLGLALALTALSDAIARPALAVTAALMLCALLAPWVADLISGERAGGAPASSGPDQKGSVGGP